MILNLYNRTELYAKYLAQRVITYFDLAPDTFYHHSVLKIRNFVCVVSADYCRLRWPYHYHSHYDYDYYALLFIHGIIFGYFT